MEDEEERQERRSESDSAAGADFVVVDAVAVLEVLPLVDGHLRDLQQEQGRLLTALEPSGNVDAAGESVDRAVRGRSVRRLRGPPLTGCSTHQQVCMIFASRE